MHPIYIAVFSIFAFVGNYYLFVRKGGIGWKVLELVVS